MTVGQDYIRYITLYNSYPEERDELIGTLDFALNSLNSRTRTLVRSTVVGGSDKTLIRINLKLFGLDPNDWDDLGKRGSGLIRSLKKIDQPDPYFHTQARSITPGEKYKTVVDCEPYLFQGKYYNQKYVERRKDDEVKLELFHAPWVDQKKIVALATATQTDFPIFRADWFIANALINPAYNKFMGIKSVKDAQRIARFRVDDVDLSTKGIVSDSQEVAHHIRAARRTPTSSGYYWETYDYLTSIREDDLLKNLLNEKRDAGEIIFTLPNTLQGYLLVNGKDELVDFADPHVAYDPNTAWRVKTVWTGVSCITCHTEGIKQVADEVRLLSRPPVALLVKKEKDFERVAELFSASIDEVVDKDREVYRKAIYRFICRILPEL